jgi:PKD repeat protein
MKKIIIIILLLSPLFLQAQISEGGTPFASQMLLKTTSEIPSYHMKSLNRAKLAEEDSLYPSPERYSVFETVNIQLKAGRYTRIPAAEGAIWQTVVVAPGAYSIQIMFDRFVLPDKAKLFLYDPHYKSVAGAFTRSNMQEDSSFVIADFFGDTLVIEYFEPDQSEFSGEVVIGKIGQAYKDMREMASGSGYIDINCPEGYEWQNEKHAVCFITFEDGGNGYMCSGALINDLKNDGKPYFLTANHCISTKAVATTLVSYFNYELQGCGGFPDLNKKSLTGSTLMTTSPLSDYTLLKLSATPSHLWKPYYAGWDATGVAVSSAVGIHHAEGLPKKISLDFDPVESFNDTISWQGGSVTQPNTHWQVRFDAGITAGGSSGSPLFSPQRKIIGQLHGGDAVYDYYGRLDYSYTRSLSGYLPLKNYLDPDNTGKLTCEAYYPSSVLPEARFAAEFNQVCLSAPVSFIDYSAFTPIAWQWTFSPSAIAFLEGTDQNSQNPVVSFSQAGKYDVSLLVTNAAGTGSKTSTDYISAGDQIDVGVSVYGSADSCIDNFSGIMFRGKGAPSFTWEILNDPENNFSYSAVDEKTISVQFSPGAAFSESVNLTVRTTGSHGSCMDTARTSFTLIKQLNDNIQNAILLAHGLNGPFSNCCSGIQEGEPVPPHTSCTGTMSWCDEYGTGENIVEHSVWFTLEGPSTGSVTIESESLDNELALYSANSWQDILDSNYSLLAANDDQTDQNPYPLLKDVSVTSGKTYWLQVDGSGGGVEGYFTLRVYDNNSTFAGKVQDRNDFIVYPQPAKDMLHIRSPYPLTGKYCVQVYSATGSMIFNAQGLDPSEDEVLVPVGDLGPGLYFITIAGDENIKAVRFIKD